MSSIRMFVTAAKFAATACIASAVVFGTIAYAIWEMRDDAFAIAISHVNDVATVFAEDVANAISTLDLMLRDAVDITQSVARGPSITKDDAERIRGSLIERRRAISQTELIAVTNETGDVISAASDFDRKTINVGDREFFTALRDGVAKGLFISKPLDSRLTHTPTVFFARRIEASDGRFLGIAFVGVEPAHLVQSHEIFTVNAHKSFSLLYADGTVALREPSVGNFVGKLMPGLRQWKEVAARGGGVLHSEGAFDNHPKYVSVRPVPQHPLFVDVGISDEAALASWRPRAISILFSGVVGLLLVAGLIYSQAKLTRRLSRSRVRSWIRAKRLAVKETELTRTRRRFGLTLDYISQGMAMYDANDKLLVANRCYAELYGLKPEQLSVGMDARDVVALRIANGAFSGTTPDEYMQVLKRLTESERLDELRTGRTIRVRVKTTDDGGRVTVQEDVTERYRAERELRHASRHDSLTQLPNRRAFTEDLARRLQMPEGGSFAILLADIDGFKEVNDTYGHEVGDGVLIEVGRRLAREAGQGVLARLGGDEFVAMTPLRQVDPDADSIADRFIKSVQAPIDFDGRRIHLGLSVGVTDVQPGARDAVDVMRHVDLALYAAKAAGRHCTRRFDENMEREHSERILLGHDLRGAIERDRLEVYYQPIVDAGDGRIVCMEALARWRHPTRGMIPPLVFIPLAEEIGLINALGDAVLRRACADASRWRSDIVVAVNVSSLQVEQSGFVEIVREALARSLLCPNRLQLEITETVLLRNNETTRSHLMRLRALGVTFALDDFGTGYASLAYLKTFPMDKIKIDKTFVDDVCANPQSIAIIGAIVALANGVGVETTAEGVETKEQADALRTIGVATMQGYYFSKPKPIDEHDIATIFAETKKNDNSLAA